MFQNVNTVLVGSTCAQPASGTGTAAIYATNYNSIAEFNTGEIFLVNEKMNVVGISSGDTSTATELRLAIKTADTTSYTDVNGTVQTAPVIKYSAPFKKGSVRSLVFNAYAAPTEDAILFDFTGVTPVVGNRYVIRFVYRDLYEHPGQFTKTYEVIATTTVLADLIAAFKTRINKDTGRRFNLSSSDAYATNFTATALAKTDNEGKESINIWTQVSMTAVAWYTNPQATGFASKIKYTIGSLDITKTAGTSGKGYWKAVRDREQAALAYKGITYRTTWPYSLLKPALQVVENETYDQVVVEFENKYLTPDNQLNSTTKQSAEAYITGTIAGSVVAERLAAFIA